MTMGVFGYLILSIDFFDFIALFSPKFMVLSLSIETRKVFDHITKHLEVHQ